MYTKIKNILSDSREPIFLDDIDNLGESLNLLYVAITRAKQKLIILTNGLNSKLITFFKQKFGKANVKGNEVLKLKTIKRED